MERNSKCLIPATFIQPSGDKDGYRIVQLDVPEEDFLARGRSWTSVRVPGEQVHPWPEESCTDSQETPTKAATRELVESLVHMRIGLINGGFSSDEAAHLVLAAVKGQAPAAPKKPSPEDFVKFLTGL